MTSATFQKPVDDTYKRDWFIFRACDGDFTDPNAAHNLAWAIKRRKSGQLVNFTVYVVYRPGENATILSILDTLKVPTDCVVMIDVEQWSGAVTGNRSTEITALATKLRTRQGGRADLVWVYGNQNDLATLYPKRPAWLGILVASYSATKPPNPGPGPLVGWQFSDGSSKWPVPSGWPRSSPPFGACDHNIIYSAPTPEGDADMPLTKADLKTLLETDGVVPAPDYAPDKSNKFWTLQSLLESIATHAYDAHARANDIDKAVTALATQVSALSKAVAAVKSELDGLKTQGQVQLADVAVSGQLSFGKKSLEGCPSESTTC